MNGHKNDDGCDIFERVDYVRNLRAINNRVEMFNLSRLTQKERKEKEGNKSVTANIYSKMKEVFKKDSSVKCKIGNQIFVQEHYEK